MPDSTQRSDRGLRIMASIIPPLGLAIWLVLRQRDPARARAVVAASLIGIPVGFAMARWVMPMVSQFARGVLS